MSLLRLALAACLFLGSSAPAFAAGGPPAAPNLEFQKFTLANGLQVILHVDRSLPIVHVNEWFHVGSKNEKPGRTGFAHLFEHMMFQGSKHADGEYFTHVESLGANLREGGVNGTTDEDRTNYFVTAPSGALEYLLWLESDRLAALLDVLTPGKLDIQREVVKNERRQSLENVPYGRWDELAVQHLYPAGHPYSWPVIGSMEDLTAATLEDVKEFFRTYYTPNNLTLTLAGDLDPARARALIEKYFGPLPPGPALSRPARLPATLAEDRVVVVADRVPQARSYLVWPGVAWFDPGDAELALAASILGDGLSSRLQKSLVYDKQLCSAASAMHGSSELAGMFVITLTARPGQSLESIERLALDEVHRLAAAGPTAAELERARNTIETGFVSGLQRIGGFGGKADQLARYNTFLGKPDMLAADLGRYREATAGSVKAAAARVLDGRKRLTLRFTPEESQRADQAEPDRSRVPAVEASAPYRFPAVHQETLPNGLRLMVAPDRELPLVSVRLGVRGGAVAEPLDKAGVALLATRCQPRGTATRGALKLEEELGALGTRLGAGLQTETASLGLDVLGRCLDPALAVLADVALNPSFPAEELERERKKALDGLLQARKDPWAICGRLAPMLVYGPEHPFGHSVFGDETSLAAISRQDLVEFHARGFVASNALLVFSGDLTAAEARQLAERHFGAWRRGEPLKPVIPAPSEQYRGKVVLVDRPDSAQSVMALILPGVARGSEEDALLQVVDTVWAGCFSSRLMLELRENKGYTYGIKSAPEYRSTTGAWVARSGVKSAVTTEAAAELGRQLDGISGSSPITPAEFEAARQTRLRGLPQGYETLNRVAERLLESWGCNRPIEELADEPARLAAAGLDDGNRLARRLARRECATLLVVGDAPKLAPGLRALGLGPVVELDPLGKPLAKRP